MSTPLLPEAYPHPISVGLEWNGMPTNERSYMIKQWHELTDQPSGILDLTAEQIQTPENITNFWELGHIAEMPLFKEVLEHSREHPEVYTRQLFYNPKTFAAPIGGRYDYCLHATPSMPEGKALNDLDHYFNRATEIAILEGDGDLAVLVSTFRAELGYLSEAEFEQGAKFIAAAWIDYLQSHPEGVMNIYSPDNGRPKSTMYALKKVLGYIEKHTESMEPENRLDIVTRLNLNPAEWTHTPDSKLIVLDDWVISGGSAADYITQAKEMAESQSMFFDDQQVEVHSIARSANADPAEGFTRRSVFLHSSSRSYREVSMAGVHFFFKYGFDNLIHTFRNRQK